MADRDDIPGLRLHHIMAFRYADHVRLVKPVITDLTREPVNV